MCSAMTTTLHMPDTPSLYEGTLLSVSAVLAMLPVLASLMIVFRLEQGYNGDVVMRT
jgi:hypothetical protein